MDKGSGCKSQTVTAAVSAGVFALLMKVSHWETGKAEQIRRRLKYSQRHKSEDLQERLCYIIAQKNGCGNICCHSHLFFAYSASCGLLKAVDWVQRYG